MSVLAQISYSGKNVPTARENSGYSLVELLVVIVIVAVLASITLRSLRNATDVARTEETRRELDRLAWAIVGNPTLVSGGARTGFGYVGDVGGLPDSLGALVNNPGGYATWDGPYIGDEFTAGSGDSEYRFDAWGQAYSYSAGVTISSGGGGSTITRELSYSVADLLYNSVVLTVTDLDNTPPGTNFADSLRLVLTYPDGSGATISSAKYPGSDGYVQFDSIPMGHHQLKVIYIPANDTSLRVVTVNPGSRYYKEINLASDVW